MSDAANGLRWRTAVLAGSVPAASGRRAGAVAYSKEYLRPI
jgi:hypothetical protein